MNSVDGNNNSAPETVAQAGETTPQAGTSNASVTLQECVPPEARKIYPRLSYPPGTLTFEYDMTHKHRGHALIFNHECYLRGRRRTRPGTDLDRDRLEKVLLSLLFEVHVHDDLSLKSIERELRRGKKFNF